MTIIASAVRALVVATAAIFAAPGAQADATIRFGHDHHPGFHKPGFGHHHFRTDKRRILRGHHVYRPPRFGSITMPFDHRPTFFHDHRHRARPPVIMPSPRVIIIERPSLPQVAKRHDGPNCREFTQKVIIDGVEQEAYGRACRVADGHWKIVD